MARMQTVAQQSLHRFIETGDLTLLEKPIIFEKTDKYQNLLCCIGATLCLSTGGLSAIFGPIATYCPFTAFKHFDLKLDNDSVQISTAGANCWCHVKKIKKTIPLEKIQDVKVQGCCIYTCFGLKQVSVHSTETGCCCKPVKVTAGFLSNPEEARQAIQTAVLVKLHKQHNVTAPEQAPGMQRGPASFAPVGAAELVDNGPLSQQEFVTRTAADVIADQAVTLNQPFGASRISIEKAQV